MSGYIASATTRASAGPSAICLRSFNARAKVDHLDLGASVQEILTLKRHSLAVTAASLRRSAHSGHAEE